MRFIGRMLDGGDPSVEAHLVLATLGVLGFVALSAYHVMIAGHAFDPGAYGQGLGYAFAGSGAAAWGQGLQRKAQNAAGAS